MASTSCRVSRTVHHERNSQTKSLQGFWRRSASSPGLVADGEMEDGVQHFLRRRIRRGADQHAGRCRRIGYLRADPYVVQHARNRGRVAVGNRRGFSGDHQRRRGGGVAQPAADERLPSGRGDSRTDSDIWTAPVVISNNADALAAGIASTHGQLDRLVRVWTLGLGIGYGTYPAIPGVWEGGHMVVTLDPKEHFCGCGGVGHLEGIMGTRAMRKRFLDMEPDEVFPNAQIRRRTLCGVRASLAPRAGRGDGEQRSHQRSGTFLHHRS